MDRVTATGGTLEVVPCSDRSRMFYDRGCGAGKTRTEWWDVKGAGSRGQERGSGSGKAECQGLLPLRPRRLCCRDGTGTQSLVLVPFCRMVGWFSALTEKQAREGWANASDLGHGAREPLAPPHDLWLLLGEEQVPQ